MKHPYRKPLILAIIAGYAVGLEFAGIRNMPVALCLAFLLYLVFGED